MGAVRNALDEYRKEHEECLERNREADAAAGLPERAPFNPKAPWYRGFDPLTPDPDGYADLERKAHFPFREI